MTDKQDEGIDYTDPDQVAELMRQRGILPSEPDDDSKEESEAKVEPEVESTDESKDEPKDETEDESEDESKDESKDETEDEPEGVLSANGKHVLPYAVLKGAREREYEARQRAEEAIARVKALEEQLASVQESAKAAAIEEAKNTLEGDELEAALAAIDEDDFGVELKKALTGAVKEAREARKRAEELAKRLEAQESAKAEIADQERREETLAEHEKAIASLPEGSMLAKLDKLRSGPLWDQAVAIDEALISSGKFEGKSRAERYAAVEAQLREVLGLPALSQRPTKKPLPEASLDVPSSISDIPGEAPATSEAEAFEKMSGVQSVAALMKMTPEQQDDFIRRNFGG